MLCYLDYYWSAVYLIYFVADNKSNATKTLMRFVSYSRVVFCLLDKLSRENVATQPVSVYQVVDKPNKRTAAVVGTFCRIIPDGVIVAQNRPVS